ncbi:MAG: ribonuclease HIII [Myxococcota bacterium]|jgi:ribonuclease HIII
MLGAMAQNTITLVMSPTEAPSVKETLLLAGFDMADAPYAFFRAKGTGCVATFYEKGKMVLQGASAEDWALHFQPDMKPPTHPFDDAMAKHPTPPPQRWAGIDEAGKGDYFGPLVVVAAGIDRSRVELLREFGVADSKRLTDKRAHELAKIVKDFCPFRKVVIGPERYNALYKKIGNLNRLLAWAHARALEDLLEHEPTITWGLSDQFARDPRLVEGALLERGKGIVFAQRTKAEADPAVAVASILARSEFLYQLKSLGSVAGRELPKGAGAPVLAAAKQIVQKDGAAILNKIAKLHFKTTQEVT